MTDKIRQALAGMMAIVDESTGVAGYHLNGNIAEWGEFPEVSAAQDALAEQPSWHRDMDYRPEEIGEPQPTVQEACDACSGKGWDWMCGDLASCPNCNGTGKRTYIAPPTADHLDLLGELYQVLGALDASEAVLDQVQAAISGEPLPHKSLLPYEPTAAKQPDALGRGQLYTCIDKGGRYELLGSSSGAGGCRREGRVVYRCLDTGQLYHRTDEDFAGRMAPLGKEGE